MSTTHRFDDEMIVEMFNSDSFGTPVSSNNGFALGKKWMDVTIAMWIEDIERGLLQKIEIYEDYKYPRDWTEGVLRNVVPCSRPSLY